MTELLALRNVSAGYGATVVLEHVSLSVDTGTTLAVLGRNGVGKTTLLATIVGHTTRHDGSITFAGQSIEHLKPYRRARLGIGTVPQEREIFPSLTVEENLTVAAQGAGISPARGADGWTLERVYALFPNLAERRRGMGNQLSGGEQQMLAIARALMGNPSLLLLDEPLEGLAPVIVDRLLEALHHLRSSAHLTMILTEQQARLALEFSDRAVILDRGRIVHTAPAAELLADPERLSTLIGVAR
ncbi:MAG: ABC transporter ATP-binding protein [Acetobacteraceae bacterium]|jgi:branched-chain amino acid transport system ATP-binding protein